ncbi:MAG: hypothetical protein EBZ48_16455, partial [Proteobacteria bacterium]|nr:hypothetical protein [Pseudomonadota bacterium]
TLAYGHSIYGVAPAAKVVPINVFSRYTGGGCPTTACVGAYTSDILDAVGWLTGTPVSGLPTAPSVVAFNMSFGGGYACSWDPVEEDAYAAAVAKNITPVAAAGNANDDTAYFTPASCSSVIAVAATGATHLKAFYSNWGDKVAIAAPGGDQYIDSEIYSTLYQSYAGWQGTSMATPHVSGTAALVWSLQPEASVAEIRRALLEQGIASGYEIIYDDSPIKCDEAKRIRPRGGVSPKKLDKISKAAHGGEGTPDPAKDKDGTKKNLIALMRKKYMELLNQREALANSSSRSSDFSGSAIDPSMVIAQGETSEAQKSLVYASKEVAVLNLTPDMRIPAIIESEIVASSTGAPQAVRVKFMLDVYNPETGVLAIPKGAIAVGTTGAFNKNTKIMTIAVSKVAVGGGRILALRMNVGSADGTMGLKGKVYNNRT